MKYTAEEVRAVAKRLHDDINVMDDDTLMASAMLIAYAERIEADEMAVAVAEVVAQDTASHGYPRAINHLYQVNTTADLLPVGTKLFTHPPAQAAQVDPSAKPRTLADFVHAPDAERVQVGQQVAARVDEMMAEPVAQTARVDQVGELLAIIHGDGGHYQAEHGLQKAAKDAQEKVIQMMTKIATAEPAQSVDVAKVREVIAGLRDYDDSAFNVWADKLEAALQEKGK